MNDEVVGGRNRVSDEDLAVLIGILSHVEAALMVEDGEQVMSSLLNRLRRDLAGFRSAPDTREAARAINERLRRALGESV